MSHSLVVVIMMGILSASVACRREQPGASDSKVFKLEELVWPEIDALDREQTMFMLPVGMVEQHGPHLPVGADTLAVVYEADRVAMRVSQALPDWNVVMMPAVPYGQGGANQLGDMMVHPGTYGIRQSTLRSIVADLGEHIAQNRFKWIFILNGHGAPPHNIAINEACDFVSEKYKVTMLHLTGLLRGDAAITERVRKIDAAHFSAADLAGFGMDVHAGVTETSGMLAVRPDLVRPSYRTLPSQAGESLEALRAVATRPGWQGYFSSPAKSTAEHGRDVEEYWIEGFTELILRAVRGENLFVHARVPDAIPPAAAPVLEKVLANEAEFETELEKWLAARKRP